MCRKQIEEQVQRMIDWLVQKDLQEWQRVMTYVQRRQALHSEHIVGEGIEPRELRRRDLVDKMGKTVKGIVGSYDRDKEASELAKHVEMAVAQTAALEVGALGFGTLVTAAVVSSSVDITGIVAAGTLAIVGFFVIPYKRNQAKEDFKRKMKGLRTRLLETLTTSFNTESKNAVERLNNGIAPYTRFVRTERERIEKNESVLAGLRQKLSSLRARSQVVTGNKNNLNSLLSNIKFPQPPASGTVQSEMIAGRIIFTGAVADRGGSRSGKWSCRAGNLLILPGCWCAVAVATPPDSCACRWSLLRIRRPDSASLGQRAGQQVYREIGTVAGIATNIDYQRGHFRAAAQHNLPAIVHLHGGTRWVGHRSLWSWTSRPGLNFKGGCIGQDKQGMGPGVHTELAFHQHDILSRHRNDRCRGRPKAGCLRPNNQCASARPALTVAVSRPVVVVSAVIADS